MKLKTFFSMPVLLLVLVSTGSCQVGSSGSFFEKIHGEQIAGDPNGPILKPEFFHCDRKESCTNVVQLKNGKYQTVPGEAEMKKIENSACVWKKYSAAAQKKEEKVCNVDALGMESRKILDDKIKASTQQEPNNVAYEARLKVGLCWIPSATDTNPWLQVDFEKSMKVTGVDTQGGSFYWTKSYEISYSHDGATFTFIKGASSNWRFDGNTDGTGIVKNEFPTPIVARYFRIYPKDKHYAHALRAEFYGCEI